MDQLGKRQIKRARGVSLFRVLSGTQFTFGFLLLFFGAYSIKFHTVSTETGMPYYSGAFIAGIMVIVQSIIGGAVFYKGFRAKTEIRALTEPKFVITLYACVTPVTTTCCLVGATLTSMFGFCLKESMCSYSTNDDFNLGMAILLLVLEMLSFILCIFSFILIGKYAALLGVACAKGGSDASNKVRPSALDHNMDDIAICRWQDKMIHDVNFGKIREYREASRQGERSPKRTVQFEDERQGSRIVTPRRQF